MSMIRSAKESGCFPYTMSTVCYFEVYKDGKVNRIRHKNKSDIDEVIKAYRNVEQKKTTLYAVWPGQWSSDLFIIDDLEEFAEGFELFSTVS